MGNGVIPMTDYHVKGLAERIFDSVMEPLRTAEPVNRKLNYRGFCVEKIESLLREADQLARQDGFRQGLAEGIRSARNSGVFEQDIQEAYTRAAEVARTWPGDGGIIKVNDLKDSIDCMNALRAGIAAAIEKLREDTK